MTDHEIARVQSKRIFFGHKSVGDNILAGMRELMLADPRLKLNIVRSANPESIAGPALIESHVGQNGNPQSKTREFAAILEQGMAAQGGIAMLKYCYADINALTDVSRMFESYRGRIRELKERYPLLRIVHATVPLTTVEPAPKEWVKSMIGKKTARAANAKRHEFNQLLRAEYAGTDPVFDLAAIESTRPDGSRAYFQRGDATIEMLAPEYTTDGGHLNETGRRAAAGQLVRVLAAL
jgi:hypothetical protein